MLPINPELLLQKIRVPNFPAETVGLVKSWKKEHRARAAKQEALYGVNGERSALLANVAELDSRARFFAAERDNVMTWREEDSRTLAEMRKDAADARAELAEFDAAQKGTPNNRPRASFRPNQISFIPSADDWFRGLPMTAFFTHVATTISPKKNEELPDLHNKLISDAEAIMTALADVEAAPLPVEDALRLFRRELKELASDGLPQIGNLFRAYVRDKRKFEQAGRVGWPEQTLSIILPAPTENGDVMTERDLSTERGSALLAALFHDQLRDFGEKLIREKSKLFTLPTMTLQERPKQVAALHDELLGVHRHIVAAELAMIAKKITFDPHPYPVHPLAVLWCAPDLERSKPPKREGAGSLVQTGTERAVIGSRS